MEALDNRLEQEAMLIADAVLPDLTSGHIDVTTLSSRVTHLSTAADARITLVDRHRSTCCKYWQDVTVCSWNRIFDRAITEETVWLTLQRRAWWGGAE